ncbi:MAG TPA: histone deacetylase [Chthoniobacterales bacterium]|jgi:acetoin utilization deacetylase AcuC-like enzyme
MTGLLLDPIYRNHDTGWDHPEAPERIDAIHDSFDSAGLIATSTRIAPRPATLEEVGRAHDPRYIETVLALMARGEDSLANGDVSVCRQSGDVALQAVGGVLNAVDAVLSGKLDNAFCAVRPPGHHATASRAMGFCIFNNVAIATRHAQAVHGVERVAILDWDVHHGNGTQDIFYADGTVLFASTHQRPWYPGTGDREETGEGSGAGLTINRPFRAGAGFAEIGAAFRDEFLPAVRAFSPQLILISAGFDSRLGDPLGEFRLTDADFTTLTLDTLETAAAIDARVVSVLEGGYSLPGLAAAANAHFRALRDEG